MKTVGNPLRRRDFWRSRQLRFRTARFEQLEHRQLLSGTDPNPAIYNLPLSITSQAAAADISNVPVGSDPGVQQMPSVAVDPHDAKHVVIAYMDYSLRDTGYAGIRTAVSHDGGVGWDYSSVPLPADFDQGAANPVVRFDGQGHIYISYMAATFLKNLANITNPASGPPRVPGFSSNNGIFVSRSDDGLTNWQTSAVASNVFNGTDKVPFEVIPSIAIDTYATLPNGHSNPRYGNLYVTWARYYPAGLFPGESDSQGGSSPMIASSSDGGQTWQIHTQFQPETGVQITVLESLSNNINDGRSPPPGYGFINWVRPTVGPDGDIYVSEFTGSSFYVSHSTDGGSSFFVPTQEDSLGLPFGLGPRGLDFGLANNAFRLQPVRAIAADPTRPGHVYAAEPLYIADASGNVVDFSQIMFSSSDDYGQHWTQMLVPVNDDNDRVLPTGSPEDVSADQLMVSLSVSADGTIGLAWLDTRADPANHLLSVYGAVSTDGGQSFGPNFRISSQSFDADAGAFTDATGKQTNYFGDGFGLALADQKAFIAWTDTRTGNQEIRFSAVPLNPAPAALNDRFESNDAAASTTQLGTVVKQHLPRLHLVAAEDDWFKFSSLATGQLKILAESTSPDDFQLQLLDNSGNNMLSDGMVIRDASGKAIGRQIVAAGQSGATYFVRLHSTAATRNSDYALTVQALTAELGSVVYRVVDGAMSTGDQAYYLFSTAAAGSIHIAATLSSGFHGIPTIELIDPQTRAVLASTSNGSLDISLAVNKDQQLLLHVFGTNASGSFSLELTNFDQFSDPDRDLLHFPAGANPSQEVLADFNRDGIVDAAFANAGSNTVSILLGNGDGLFAAPRQFAIGAFRLPNLVGDDFDLSTFRREIVTGDFNEDGIVDLAATNYDSADVSVLLGRGDGTFQPQRRFDATDAPYGMTLGDVNNDGHLDLVAFDAIQNNLRNIMAVLLGRGDGSFAEQRLVTLPEILPEATPELVDLDRDGKLDLIIGGAGNTGLDVFKGDGQGNFNFFGKFIGTRQATDIVVADVDGDGNLDVLATSISVENSIFLLSGNGDGSFKPPQLFFSGQTPIALQLVDFGSEIFHDDGPNELGPRDGHPDLVVANSGVVTAVGQVPDPSVVVIPALFSDSGEFKGYGDPFKIASAVKPLDVKVADFNRDGVQDIGVVDVNEFFAIYGAPPQVNLNGSQATARDLRTVVHFVQPTVTITPQQADAWYRLTVPTEAVSTAKDEVLDFSGGFTSTAGAGLGMEVVDAAGKVRGSGERFRVVAKQGEMLFVHVFGKTDEQGAVGAGAYTLAIDTLPQITAVEAESLLPGEQNVPGGPITSLVLVIRGDRLDPAAAENPANYTITWLGRDGNRGTADDRSIPLAAGAHSIVYDASSNVDVASGLTFPTAIRQTVTLLFDQALPAGSYEIKVSPAVVSTEFSLNEMSLLSPQQGFSGHPLVSVSRGTIVEGADVVMKSLVKPNAAIGNLSAFEQGTRFLTQFHNDMGALLDAQLTAKGDQTSISQELLDHIVSRFAPGLGPLGQRLTSLAIFWFDPVSIGLVDPEGRTFQYNLQTSTLATSLPKTFAEVGGNVEVVVIANPTGTYHLNIADAASRARGGVVFLGNQPADVKSLTDAIRKGADSDGTSSFSFTFDAIALPHSPVVNVLAAAAISAGAVEFLSPTIPAQSPLPSATNGTLPESVGTQIATAASFANQQGGSAMSVAAAQMREIWDEVSGLWIGLNRKLRQRRQGDLHEQSNDASDASLLPQIWEVMSGIFEATLQHRGKSTTSNRGSNTTPAHQTDASKKSDQAEPQTNQTSGESADDSSGAALSPDSSAASRSSSDSGAEHQTINSAGGSVRGAEPVNSRTNLPQTPANTSTDDENPADATAA